MPQNSLSEYHLSAQELVSINKPGYNGITLLYVVKGEIQCTNESECYNLTKNDIHLINNNTPYDIKGTTSNIVLSLEIANHYFSRYYKTYFYHRYSINLKQMSDFQYSYLNNIRVLIAKMMIAYIQDNDEFSLLEINRLISEMLLILVSYFREKNFSIQRKNYSYSKRIQKIITFLEDNYQEQITLSKVSQNEYISLSYLSRLFKKEVGVNFIQYLTKIRFEHAVYDLLNTSNPVYRITETHGFTNPKQFISLFKEAYKKTPNQFRNEQKNDPNTTIAIKKNNNGKKQFTDATIRAADIVETISLLSLIIDSTESQNINHQYAPVEELAINLNPQYRHEPLCKLQHIITIGELNELLKEHVKQQLLIIKQQAHVNYVEVSQLISGKTILPELRTDEPIPTDSPYNNADISISFLKEHNMYLLIRINHQSVVKDTKSYIEKLLKFLKHNINLHGKEYVQNWCFIYCCDDNNQINQTSYKACYFLIRNKIKAHIAEIKIGLYYPFNKSSFINQNSFFPLRLIKATDFIGYSACFNEQIDLSQLENQQFNNHSNNLQLKTSYIKQSLAHNFIDIPIMLMRWNTLTGNTRHTNGQFFRAALIFNTILELSSQIDSIAISLNTEIQQEKQQGKIDVSGISLFYIANSRRPAFYALKFLEKLQGRVIAKGQDYIVTQSHSGYQLVLTNTAIFNPYLSIEQYAIQHFRKIKMVILNGIASGQYQIKHYIFDQQHGALYKQYEQFYTRYGRDQEVIDHIDRQTIPNLTLYDEFIHSERWVTTAELDINAIHFYELRSIMI